ncbi:MAG: phage tail spike protein [Desulfitobacteriaceae bacterium]
MINLYDSTETNFSHNGLVVLSDCKTAYVEELLNDKFELELEYPIDKRGKWLYIIEGNIIKVGGQLFRIYHKEKTLSGIKVSARHIFYDLLDNFVESCSIGSLNAAGALNGILSNTQYTHGFTSMSDIDTSNTYAIDKQNPVEVIMGNNGVISIYGGELVRDNFTIRLLQARGMDRGVLISYGKNVIGIDETLDMGNVVTRLMPIGKNGLLLTEKYIDSSLISNYPHPIVKFIEFRDCETEDDIRSAGQTYLGQNDKPLVNYKVDFIELTKTVEYAKYAILETVYMGDTVTVRHSRLGIDLKCKVIRIKKNELTHRIEEVELGSFKPNLASSINGSIATIRTQQTQDKSDLQTAINNATAQINSALGGYVIKRNGELLIMDTEDINTATKVWRWNQGGLGYSGTGYNGPFRTAITADGHIVADFVDTGELTASLIKTGTITSKTGKLSIGLDDEVLNIGGKIIYDGETGEVTFDPSVVLSWDNITDKPTLAPSNADNTEGKILGNGFTKIGSNYVYTGTLTAEQINAILIAGVTITASEELAIRGVAVGGTNPKLIWQCTDSIGESSIRDTPTNPGDSEHEADTLFWEINGNDPTGADETYRGRIFICGPSSGWADIIVHGTIQTGNGSTFASSPFGVDNAGNLYCHALNVNGVDISSGGGGGTPGPTTMELTWDPDRLSFDIVEGSNTLTWTVTRDEYGRITNFTSSEGDDLDIVY